MSFVILLWLFEPAHVSFLILHPLAVVTVILHSVENRSQSNDVMSNSLTYESNDIQVVCVRTGVCTSESLRILEDIVDVVFHLSS